MTLEGDEWKRAPCPPAGPRVYHLHGSRAQRQATVDALYGAGRITLDHWRILSGLLSDPVEWSKVEVA